MEQATGPKEREAHAFASEIARHLEHGRAEGSFEELVLVAPPAFLGLLRAELNEATRGAVTRELNKNLVEADTGTLERQISAVLKS